MLAGERPLQPGAAVYACNHSSNVEPPAVFLALRTLHPSLKVLYKAELRSLPILVWVFDVAGFVPVERSNRDQSFGAVDRADADFTSAERDFLAGTPWHKHVPARVERIA